MNILIFCLQIFKTAYCDPFSPHHLEEAKSVCKEFIMAVKDYKPELLQRPKFHYLLLLPSNMLDFGPTAAFNTERSVWHADYTNQFPCSLLNLTNTSHIMLTPSRISVMLTCSSVFLSNITVKLYI